jgi:membrane associated rhomboid family serine protease
VIPLKDENPGERFPLMTVGLVAANLIAFLYQATLPEEALNRFIMSYGVVPAELLGRAPRLAGGPPAALTLVTSQFLHGGLFHLLGNMLYLWIFGNNIEDLLGRVRFVIFYLACGVLAAAAHLVLNPYSTIPMVGASGAIAGVLGAYLISFPRHRVLVLVVLIFFFTTAYVPAFLVLGLWFVMQFFYAAGDAGGAQATNVAYMAHIGGFVAGMWLLRLLRPRHRWR